MKSVSSALQVADRLHEVSGIDIGDETECYFTRAVMLERLVRHDGPEVGPPDADIDDVLDRFPGETLEFAGADPGGKVTHTREHGVDVRHDVLPVDDERGRGRQPKRRVQHRPVL